MAITRNIARKPALSGGSLPLASALGRVGGILSPVALRSDMGVAVVDPAKPVGLPLGVRGVPPGGASACDLLKAGRCRVGALIF